MKAGSKERMEGIVRQWFSEFYPKRLAARLLHLKSTVKLISIKEELSNWDKNATHRVCFEVWHKGECLAQGALLVGKHTLRGDGGLLDTGEAWPSGSKMELYSEFCIKN